MILHHFDPQPKESLHLSPHIRTLSDYPLLIGEILRRNDIRARRHAGRVAFTQQIKAALGLRQAAAGDVSPGR